MSNELSYICPNCGGEMTYAAEHRGMSSTCPHCQNEVTLGGVAPKGIPKAVPQSGQNNTAKILTGLASLVLVIGLIAAKFYFGGKMLSQAQLESEVRKNIAASFHKNLATFSTEIKSFNLVHNGGNSYKGVLVAQTDNKTETAQVDVTYDGRTFVWKIIPQTDASAQDAPSEPTKGSGDELATIRDLTAKVRAGIERKLSERNSATQLQHITISHIGGDKYTGNCEFDIKGGKATATVDITYDGNDLSWELKDITPQQDPNAKLEWNTKEIDAAENGNMAVAVQTITQNPNIKAQATTAQPASVAKAPWNYYGKPLKFTGRVEVVQDYPPDSDIVKQLGGTEASEMVILCADSTIADMFCMKSSGTMQVGDSVNLYGYAVGITEVPNKLGGTFTHLVIVGNSYDNFSRR